MTPTDLRGRAAQMRSLLPPPPTGGGPPQDLGHRLLTLPRGHDEELRLSLDVYEGRPFLNARIWTKDMDGRGWWPSKRGVTFKLRELADVAEALATALDLMAEHQAPRPAGPGPRRDSAELAERPAARALPRPAGPGPRRDRPVSPEPPPPARSGGGEFSEFSEF